MRFGHHTIQQLSPTTTWSPYSWTMLSEKFVARQLSGPQVPEPIGMINAAANLSIRQP